MTTMIERCAKVAADTAALETPEWPGHEMVCLSPHVADRIVRAVIQTLREHGPTEVMLNAVRLDSGDDWIRYDIIFQRLLDAALAETADG